MIKKLLDFKGLKIQLASPETIREWSHGEVTKPETINYRTLKPEKDGLFCERIFGPTKDYECYCGKYKRIRYRGIVCDKCGVEVTQSKVRRERLGHISLAAPIAHIWYFKGAPSKLSLLLNIPPKNLSNVIYFSKYLILEVDNDKKKQVLTQIQERQEEAIHQLEEEAKKEIERIKNNLEVELAALQEKQLSKDKLALKTQKIKLKAKRAIELVREQLALDKEASEEIYKTVTGMARNLKRGTVISEEEYLKLEEYGATDHLKVGMGAEAILEYMQGLDLQEISSQLRQQIKEEKGAKQKKIAKRLKVVEGLKNAGIDPSWTILRVLPVLPPDLRPMVQLSGGRFASSDLNDLYRRVINRNNRLKHLIELGAPEIILRNEKRMLQEAVDSLIDSSQAKVSRRRNAKQLRSLSDMLSGKQGRFRQNLLGKRVDYSGRSVIVVGPKLNINQCGLPKEMALEMFKPYVLHELIARGIAPNVKSAKHAIERRDAEVFDILEDITKNHPVLLNRAPTLHKLGIQAFYPILIEGSAIQLHPCVCAGYNADFDGDQMAVHVPLSKSSIEEIKAQMMPDHNLLKPANGSPITVPNKDMALGCYYLTSVDPETKPASTIFSEPQEAHFAYQTGNIGLRQLIKVRFNDQIIETTVGRLIFNEIMPEEFGFLNEPIPAKKIVEIVRQAITSLDSQRVTKLVDDIKDLGFKYLTISGLSVAVSDNIMIKEKDEIIRQAEEKVNQIQENYNQGLITEEERKRLSFDVWMKTTEEIADKTWAKFSDTNAVKIIINSGGTRASRDQVKQLSAMRGLVVDPLGKIVEMPTKSNFREGLTIFEYVTSSRGSRKGLTDSALKTADAGYLTRRLVDVSHASIIRQEDCGTKEHLLIKRQDYDEKRFSKKILGRVLAKLVKHPKTKEVLGRRGDIIDDQLLQTILDAKVEEVAIRSPLTCQSRYGVCQKCYGWDFGTRQLVEIGTPIGVLAAQSIGEPGTQLTMRVKHSGGIVGLDVTQGLPRVEELFEARTPKVVAPLATISGKVKLEEVKDGTKVIIKSTSKTNSKEEEEFLVPNTLKLIVKDGDLVTPGTPLAEGPLDPKETLKVLGIRGTQLHLIEEIQKVYESQGIPIADIHFEVIVREMSNKVKIEESGDTSLIPGEIVDRFIFTEENEKILAEGGEPATAKTIILGITRASLHTNSWLSAASFQETTNVLATAALEGKEDPLLGLKENVIIGRLIPTSKERAMLDR